MSLEPSYLAAMEMLATGTTCSLNHSVTTTGPDLVKASIEPQAELGIRQVYAKELRCKTPGNPRHPKSLDEALSEFEDEVQRWDGKHDGLIRFGIAIESNAHWVAADMSMEEFVCRGHELAKRLGLKITAHISGGTFSLEKGFLKYLRETGRTDVRYLMLSFPETSPDRDASARLLGSRPDLWRTAFAAGADVVLGLL